MMEYITRFMDCSLSAYFDGRYDPNFPEEHHKNEKTEEENEE